MWEGEPRRCPHTQTGRSLSVGCRGSPGPHDTPSRGHPHGSHLHHVVRDSMWPGRQPGGDGPSPRLLPLLGVGDPPRGSPQRHHLVLERDVLGSGWRRLQDTREGRVAARPPYCTGGYGGGHPGLSPLLVTVEFPGASWCFQATSRLHIQRDRRLPARQSSAVRKRKMRVAACAPAKRQMPARRGPWHSAEDGGEQPGQASHPQPPPALPARTSWRRHGAERLQPSLGAQHPCAQLRTRQPRLSSGAGGLSHRLSAALG